MVPQGEEKGQSAVLVAISLLVLVIFAAITVDISSAYLGRRTAQNAADAAALAASGKLEIQFNTHVYDDNVIKIALNDFGERNGAGDTDGTLANEVNDDVTGFYLDADQHRITGGVIGDGDVPAGTMGVESVVYITTPAFFGGIMGRSGYQVQARAVVMLDIACGEDCVVPIATHSMAFDDYPPGSCFNIWNGDGPGNFGWLNWSWQGYNCHQDDCSSVCLSDNLENSTCQSGFIKVGDLVAGTTGVSNDVKVQRALAYYYGPPPRPFTIVVWEENNGLQGCGNGVPGDYSSSGLHYVVAGFARMQILGWQLSQGKAFPDISVFDPATCITLGIPPNDGNRISATFLGWAGGEGGNCRAVGSLYAGALKE